MGVILVSLAILGALTAMALFEGYRLDRPVTTALALLSILVLGAVLLTE